MKRLNKNTKLIGIVAAIVIVILVLVAFIWSSNFSIQQNDQEYWGPERESFTIESPAGYVTWNSITDNPAHGDERNFMQVREANASNETYVDEISLISGKEYVIYIYYHNNATSSLNDNGAGIAEGAYVKAQIPAIVAKNSSNTAAVSYVGSENAIPAEVWDGINFINETKNDINLKFVSESAIIHSFGLVNGEILSDDIITTGTPIGFDALDGIVPGCNEYAGYVTLRIIAE